MVLSLLTFKFDNPNLQFRFKSHNLRPLCVLVQMNIMLKMKMFQHKINCMMLLKVKFLMLMTSINPFSRTKGSYIDIFKTFFSQKNPVMVKLIVIEGVGFTRFFFILSIHSQIRNAIKSLSLWGTFI